MGESPRVIMTAYLQWIVSIQCNFFLSFLSGLSGPSSLLVAGVTCLLLLDAPSSHLGNNPQAIRGKFAKLIKLIAGLQTTVTAASDQHCSIGMQFCKRSDWLGCPTHDCQSFTMQFRHKFWLDSCNV